MEIAIKARNMFEDNYRWDTHVRAVAVRFNPQNTPQQLDIFIDNVKKEKQEQLDDAVENIRGRFGERATRAATLLGDLKIPGQGVNEVIMPGIMYR